MKHITDEDYDTLVRLSELAVYSSGPVYVTTGDARDFVALCARYDEKSAELFVVEVDDPNTVPTPTWGPFTELDGAAEFVVERFGPDTICEAFDYPEGPVAKVYFYDTGTHVTIKRLQPPTN